MVSSMLIVLERSSEAMGEVVVYRYVVIIMTMKPVSALDTTHRPTLPGTHIFRSLQPCVKVTEIPELQSMAQVTAVNERWYASTNAVRPEAGVNLQNKTCLIPFHRRLERQLRQRRSCC